MNATAHKKRSQFCTFRRICPHICNSFQYLRVRIRSLEEDLRRCRCECAAPPVPAYALLQRPRVPTSRSSIRPVPSRRSTVAPRSKVVSRSRSRYRAEGLIFANIPAAQPRDRNAQHKAANAPKFLRQKSVGRPALLQAILSLKVTCENVFVRGSIVCVHVIEPVADSTPRVVGPHSPPYKNATPD